MVVHLWLGYLICNLACGEGCDWYCASTGDLDNQVRTPRTDGSGKPRVSHYKDVRARWENAHFNRPSGDEVGTATSWVPQSKPIWIMEAGCPAIDKGSHQPDVFYNPKSFESAVPYDSEGHRDDFMQRRNIQAMVESLDPSHVGYAEDANPT